MNTKSSGFIFLEILIAISIISVVFITFLGMSALAVNTSYNIQKSAEADALIKEEVEALRSFRDGSTWATNGLGTVAFTSSSPYYVSLNTVPNPDAWALTSGTETVGMFTRKIWFDKVSRDPSTSNIESTYNAAHDDANTRKVTVSVVRSSTTSTAILYLTNWQQQ